MRRSTGRVLGLAVLHALVLLVVFRGALDNAVVNAYAETSTDALEYVSRSRLLFTDFTAAFADGWRLPGYPLFLSAVDQLFPRPWLAARVIQVLASSSLIVLTFLAVRRTQGRRAAWSAAGVVALWPALHYFAPILIAETLSLLTVGLLVLLLAGLASSCPPERGWWAFGLGVVLAAATYLKPNQILMSLPVAAAIGVVVPDWRARLQTAGTTAAVTVLLVAPWSIFVSSVNDRVVPLATTQGINLYDGAGLSGIYATEADTVHATAARALDLETGEAPRRGPQGAQQAERYRRRALAAWRDRPLELSVYGGAKVLHALGFSFRGLRDLAVAAFSVVALAGSVWLWRRDGQRLWPLFLWTSAAVVALQAFVFLPNQRLKVVGFDLPAAIVVGLATERSVTVYVRSPPASREDPV